MNKLALNFICKNESHVVLRMLNSAKNITDLIVVNDTGSDDGTQDIIRNFGRDNNIPTYVFERPFDNFENSRNHAMSKLREVVQELRWDPDSVHGYWFDCDEQLIISEDFDKSQFKNDLYMINTLIGTMKYTRNTFFRVSKPFRWYGPVHEFIVCDDKTITSGLAEGIHVDVKMEGASWKGDISAKYKSHAFELEKYIDKSRKDPRWIFYTAQSWHDSASSKDFEENSERLRRALKYYRERVDRKDGYKEEIYYSQYRVGSIMKSLEEPWAKTHQELLKAYSIDPSRGEAIKVIIDYYLKMGEWDNAYIYTLFSINTFHNKNPYPNKLLFIDQSLYNWKFLEAHAVACFYSGRKSEAIHYYNELFELANSKPEMFTEQDINKIKSNKKYFK